MKILIILISIVVYLFRCVLVKTTTCQSQEDTQWFCFNGNNLVLCEEALLAFEHLCQEQCLEAYCIDGSGSVFNGGCPIEGTQCDFSGGSKCCNSTTLATCYHERLFYESTCEFECQLDTCVVPCQTGIQCHNKGSFFCCDDASLVYCSDTNTLELTGISCPNNDCSEGICQSAQPCMVGSKCPVEGMGSIAGGMCCENNLVECSNDLVIASEECLYGCNLERKVCHLEGEIGSKCQFDSELEWYCSDSGEELLQCSFGLVEQKYVCPYGCGINEYDEVGCLINEDNYCIVGRSCSVTECCDTKSIAECNEGGIVDVISDCPIGMGCFIDSCTTSKCQVGSLCSTNGWFCCDDYLLAHCNEEFVITNFIHCGSCKDGECIDVYDEDDEDYEDEDNNICSSGEKCDVGGDQWFCCEDDVNSNALCVNERIYITKQNDKKCRLLEHEEPTDAGGKNDGQNIKKEISAIEMVSYILGGSVGIIGLVVVGFCIIMSVFVIVIRSLKKKSNTNDPHDELSEAEEDCDTSAEEDDNGVAVELDDLVLKGTKQGIQPKNVDEK